MLRIFYSGTENSGKSYFDILNKLKDLEERKIIGLTFFPSDKHFCKQNNFPDLIINKIIDADVFIVLFDKISQKNQWVNQEVGIAMSKNVYILALASNISGLYGFVNKNKQTIIKPSPEELENRLNKISQEMKEKLLERDIENQILEINKIIDCERVKSYPKNQDFTHEVKKLNTIENNLQNLNKYKNEKGFYLLPIIDILINDHDFIKNTKFYSKAFKGEYSRLIQKLSDYKNERIQKIK